MKKKNTRDGPRNGTRKQEGIFYKGESIKMKKGTIILALMLTALSLSACGKNAAGTTAPTSGAMTSEETETLGEKMATPSEEKGSTVSAMSTNTASETDAASETVMQIDESMQAEAIKDAENTAREMKTWQDMKTYSGDERTLPAVSIGDSEIHVDASDFYEKFLAVSGLHDSDFETSNNIRRFENDSVTLQIYTGGTLKSLNANYQSGTPKFSINGLSDGNTISDTVNTFGDPDKLKPSDDGNTANAMWRFNGNDGQYILNASYDISTMKIEDFRLLQPVE